MPRAAAPSGSPESWALCLCPSGSRTTRGQQTPCFLLPGGLFDTAPGLAEPESQWVPNTSFSSFLPSQETGSSGLATYWLCTRERTLCLSKLCLTRPYNRDILWVQVSKAPSRYIISESLATTAGSMGASGDGAFSPGGSGPLPTLEQTQKNS